MASFNPPPSGERRRPLGPRDAGDAWVSGEQGKFWGRFGAAGVLVHDENRGILLQHRATWSDQGGTWGLPGGALHAGEDAVTGALREAQEEAAIPAEQMRILFTSVFDVGYWSYTTVGARVTEQFEPVISDPESIELRWVQPADVAQLPLHSGFADSWPTLWTALRTRTYLVVDAANVVGSRPDGWWRDRKKGAQKLIDGLSSVAERGLSAFNAGGGRFWPEIVVVTEGRARGAEDSLGGVRVVAADRDGDQSVVDTVHQLRAEDGRVLVVTADRGLRSRVLELGAEIEGPGWLLAQISDSGPAAAPNC